MISAAAKLNPRRCALPVCCCSGPPRRLGCSNRLKLPSLRGWSRCSTMIVTLPWPSSHWGHRKWFPDHHHDDDLHLNSAAFFLGKLKMPKLIRRAAALCGIQSSSRRIVINSRSSRKIRISGTQMGSFRIFARMLSIIIAANASHIGCEKSWSFIR